MPLLKRDPPQYNGYSSQAQPPSLFAKLRQWLYSGGKEGRSAAVWDPEYTANARPDAGYHRKALRTTHRASSPVYPKPPRPPFIPPPLPNHSRSRSSNPTWTSQNQHSYPYASTSIVPSKSYPSKSQRSLDRRHDPYSAREHAYTSTPAYRSGKPHHYHTKIRHPSEQYTITPTPRNRSSSSLPRPHRGREEQHRSHHSPRRGAKNAKYSSSSLPRQHRGRDERRRDHYTTQRDVAYPDRSRNRSGGRNPPRRNSESENYDAPFALVDELIPSVTSYPSVDWNICLPLSSAFKWIGPDAKCTIRFETLAINPPVKEVRIFALKDNGALSLVLAKFGPIKVTSRDNLTIGDILAEIRKYFHTPLHVREMDALTPDLRSHVSRSYQRRWDSQGKDIMGEPWPKLSYWGPIRADMLFSFFQYAGLQMDERFGETRRLYLTLENRWSTRL